jgi:signal transduction histidine kinase
MLTLLAAYENTLIRMPPVLRASIESLPAHAELQYIREDAPDLLRECKEGLARVKRIVSDLRDFSRVDTADFASSDIQTVLDSALQVVWNELKYKAEVIKEFAPLPPVVCSATQLGQVFVNLLVNAAHAIEGRGTITLRTGSGQDSVWIEIIDTGVGMSVETQKRIFEPFYTTKPVGQGTGLGLSISWEIVERHGGSLEVQSSLGHGTCFRITLPTSQAIESSHGS